MVVPVRARAPRDAAASAASQSPDVRVRPAGAGAPLRPEAGPRPDDGPVLAHVTWSGTADAADAVLAHLQQHLGMDLWALTRVEHGTQRVQAARSGTLRIPAGTELPWMDALSRQVLAGAAPRVATDASVEMAFAAAGVDRRFRVGAYVVVPLVGEDGRLLGTLCGLSAAAQPPALAGELPLVELLARLLGTLRAKEEFAAERSAEAAAAYAVAERDSLTGLLNRRGWQRALGAEDQRCLRGGRCSAVAVVDLDGLGEVNESRGHEVGDELLVLAAQVLQTTVRPCDEVARIGGDEFALIAADAGADGVHAWTARLSTALAAAGVEATGGAAASGAERRLSEAWRAAEDAMLADKHARRGPRRRSPRPVP
ncbi:sensor domain-containing diguanylate cyclase [Kineococcus glutinatus]|uniref:GGDEF domain-containing protein n=1 Tax=Kineococcus glutinatus TaxID=1070872 RepID=UPI0031ED274A